MLFCGKRLSSSHADAGDQGGALSICSLIETFIYEVSFLALWCVFVCCLAPFVVLCFAVKAYLKFCLSPGCYKFADVNIQETFQDVWWLSYKEWRGMFLEAESDEMFLIVLMCISLTFSV